MIKMSLSNMENVVNDILNRLKRNFITFKTQTGTRTGEDKNLISTIYWINEPQQQQKELSVKFDRWFCYKYSNLASVSLKNEIINNIQAKILLEKERLDKSANFMADGIFLVDNNFFTKTFCEKILTRLAKLLSEYGYKNEELICVDKQCQANFYNPQRDSKKIIFTQDFLNCFADRSDEIVNELINEVGERYQKNDALDYFIFDQECIKTMKIYEKL